MKTLALMLLALPSPALAQSAPKVGDTVQILRQSESSQQSEGSTSSSSDTDAMTERVVAVRPDGVELDYDVPHDGDASNWQFPARIFRPARGPLRLLNAPELEQRVDGWLKQGGMTRAACGHWIFTWNAFRIECDPQSALEIVRGFQLEPDDLREGAAFSMPGALGSAPLKKTGSARFTAELAVDPEAVRKARADRDIVVAELNRQTLTADAARRAHAGDVISGRVTVTFDLDAGGHVARRTEVTKLEVKPAKGPVETRTVTTVLQRQSAPRPPRDPNMI